MDRDWETRFAGWAAPPGRSEQERSDNAVRAVRRALDADEMLAPITKVYVQGSYRNRVNVRQDSDVDIGVLCTADVFGVDYPVGMGDADFGNGPAPYRYSDFKDSVGLALVRQFGADSVRRGKKTFDVHENTYRIEADVTPMFVHRRYSADGAFICGVELRPDDGGRVVNWPERILNGKEWPDQHYENGVAKNDATGRTYKGVVRILKRLRAEMESVSQAAAKLKASGFFLECLVWNVPTSYLGETSWDANLQNALSFLWKNTESASMCADWGEVSELKYLFRGSPDSRRALAHQFLDDAWSCVGVRRS
jgi:hypothetical protein